MWKTIDKRYRISNKGTIYDLKYNCLVKPFLNSKGYWQVRLYIHGKIRIGFIHRLVFGMFGKNIPDGMVINHIDHNKRNNNINNLELVSQSENMKAYYKHKRKHP